MARAGFIDVDPAVLQDACRICMAQNISMQPLFGVKQDFAEKILYCTGISVEKGDGLPAQMCFKCVVDLTTAHRFKSTCLSSDEMFLKILQSVLSIDPDEPEYLKEDPICIDDDTTDCDDDRTEIGDDIDKTSNKRGRKKIDENIDDDKTSNIRGRRKIIKNYSFQKKIIKNDSVQKKIIKNDSVQKKIIKNESVQKKKINNESVQKKKINNESVGKKMDNNLLDDPLDLKAENSLETDKNEKQVTVSAKKKGGYGYQRKRKRKAKSKLFSRVKGLNRIIHECEECHMKFDTKWDLNRHMRSMQEHGNSSLANIYTVHECEECSTKFNTKWDLNRHVRSMHEHVEHANRSVANKYTIYECEACHTKFDTKWELNRHVRSMHQHANRGVANKYTCETCGATFALARKYKRHMDVHSNQLKREQREKEREAKMEKKKLEPVKVPPSKKVRKRKHFMKKIFCHICEMRFMSKLEAELHKRTHPESDTYICQFCGDTCTDRASFIDHLKQHRAPHYQCDHCDFATGIKGSIVKHLQRRHTDLRPFKCHSCPSAFKWLGALNRHIERIHERALNFFCHICAKGFYEKGKLRVHLDSHNKIKRYKCVFCGSLYTRRDTLKKHLLDQHEFNVPPARTKKYRKHGANDEIVLETLIPAPTISFDHSTPQILSVKSEVAQIKSDENELHLAVESVKNL